MDDCVARILAGPRMFRPNVSRFRTIMRDVIEVLRQKEAELVRLREEVAALRLVVSLLGEDDSSQTSAEPQTDQPSTSSGAYHFG